MSMSSAASACLRAELPVGGGSDDEELVPDTVSGILADATGLKILDYLAAISARSDRMETRLAENGANVQKCVDKSFVEVIHLVECRFAQCKVAAAEVDARLVAIAGQSVETEVSGAKEKKSAADGTCDDIELDKEATRASEAASVHVVTAAPCDSVPDHKVAVVTCDTVLADPILHRVSAFSLRAGSH